MTKREVFQLLHLISVYYDPYEINQKKVDEWYYLLKEDSFSRLKKNSHKHAAHSAYAPRVSELIRNPENGSRAIPNYEEALDFFNKKIEGASKEPSPCLHYFSWLCLLS